MAAAAADTVSSSAGIESGARIVSMATSRTNYLGVHFYLNTHPLRLAADYLLDLGLVTTLAASVVAPASTCYAF